MNNFLARSHVLKALIALPAAAFAALSAPRIADAAKGSKAQFKYQDTPKNGQKCADCRFYIRGKTRNARGGCTLVAGSISPNGWCIAYAKKKRS